MGYLQSQAWCRLWRFHGSCHMVWVAALQDGQNPCGEGFDNFMNNDWIFCCSSVLTHFNLALNSHLTTLSAPCQLWMAAKALSKPIWILSGFIRIYLCSNEKPSETNNELMLLIVQGVDSLKGAVNPYMPYTTTKPKVFPITFSICIAGFMFSFFQIEAWVPPKN